MNVPFADLKSQYQSIKAPIQTAVNEVLNSASFVLGPAVSSFEKKFAAYVDAKHVIAVNSGTSALHLALLATGVGAGDEVIVPAMTFLATVAAVDYTGAKPVLVDVDPVSYTMDPSKIEAAITPRTKVIMPVHLYGQAADMDAIRAIASRHKLLVIEDAAQAHGAKYKGKSCGSLGDLAGFSFYPGKNLGAYGEGGAVTTNNDDYARKITMMRDWGSEKKYIHEIKGFNYRMEGLQGAVLGVKMDYIEDWTEKRRKAAQRYQAGLSGQERIIAPKEMPYARHVYHVYAVMVSDRANTIKKLQDEGISTGIHYPIPIHLQPCFAGLGYAKGDFPVAERVADNELSLPMFPEITDAQIDYVTSTLIAAKNSKCQG
jgi:dTDP-4-amino-4,6-dideoxygalactose transaminase